jgi:hypothetical protein
MLQYDGTFTPAVDLDGGLLLDNLNSCIDSGFSQRILGKTAISRPVVNAIYNSVEYDHVTTLKFKIPQDILRLAEKRMRNPSIQEEKLCPALYWSIKTNDDVTVVAYGIVDFERIPLGVTPIG